MTRPAVTFGLCAVMLGLAAALLRVDGPLGPGATDRLILLHIRLPRMLLAGLTGAMLGMAGSLLQTVLRNPLATPDVIGFGGGAAAGVAVSIVTTGGLALVLPAALVGGGLSAVLVLGLTWRNGVQPLQLVLVGVAANLMLFALTDVLLSLAPGLQAGETARFLTGSFAAAHWPAVAWAALACALAGAVALATGFGLSRLDMGDDLARSQGLNPSRLRLVAIVLSAALTSLEVGQSGPLPFVALLAGPIARHLLGVGGPAIFHAALVGAALALAADLAAHLPIGGTTLPAGLYTSLVGGPAMLAIILMSKERS
ncbi:iron chelate uptake ABC transporter family permease subunit [Actibacterium ureilyticum]|uniref:iron chelate uptake ABC transporter family permease subunit n=1 Tax=Actibacterium ureilyticum TaxID=1590614 RepID=UPI001140B9E1|nr:iron chelate uptake ABC transporter family permease subunit [Actibacterium ureilyticum]